MFRNPVPRSSFLDSPLRARGHENRRLAHRTPIGDSHLGRGHRLAAARPALSGRLHEAAGPRSAQPRA